MIENGTIVVFKRGYKWYKAKIGGKRDAFTAKTKLKKLSDVKGDKNYITLALYIKKNNLPIKEEDVLKTYDVERLYIKSKGRDSVESAPQTNSLKKLDSYWWSELNEVCLSCIRECKQSSMVILSCCPQYSTDKE